MQVEIKDKLYKDIVGYCELNNLDVTDYINDLLKKEFVIDKYGEKPGIFEKSKPIVEKVKPTISSDEIIPIDMPMNEPDKANLEEMKKQAKVVVVVKNKETVKQTKVISELINDSELINEPIKQDETVEIPFTLEPVVVDYSKTEELKPEPPMITREELMEMYSQEKTQEKPKKRRRKLS